jgi:hypothetical protein
VKTAGPSFVPLTPDTLKTAKRQEALKKEVELYLHRLETYITDSDQNLDITVVETHAALAAEVAHVK